MKQALLIAVLMLCGVISSAQRIRFTDTSNQWTFVDINNDGGYISGSIETDKFGTDTVILSKRYRRFLHHARGATWQLSLAVREDTAANKLYFRFLSSTFGSNATDTAEHVFFDYNLQLNDTLSMDYSTYHARHVAVRLDSLRIGNGHYKRWRMLPAGSIAGGYTFIEGIGCVAQIDYPVFDYFFEDLLQLRCFRNSTGQPSCAPATELPYWRGYVNEGFYQTDSFDNASSCTITPVAVPIAATSKLDVVIAPNPGGKESILKLPTTQDKILFSISNVMGQLIKQGCFEGGMIVPVGQYLKMPGIYYYILQDAATGQRYTGRFVFQ